MGTNGRILSLAGFGKPYSKPWNETRGDWLVYGDCVGDERYIAPIIIKIPLIITLFYII